MQSPLTAIIIHLFDDAGVLEIVYDLEYDAF